METKQEPRVEAIEVSAMDSVGVRYESTCSNNLLGVMTDADPICVSDLLPVRYFGGQMRVWVVLYL